MYKENILQIAKEGSKGIIIYPKRLKVKAIHTIAFLLIKLKLI